MITQSPSQPDEENSFCTFWVFYPFPRNHSGSGTGRSPRIITDAPSARMVWLCQLPLQSTEASEGIGRDQKEGLWRPSRGPGGKGGGAV